MSKPTQRGTAPKARTCFALFMSLLSSSERVRFSGLIVARIALGGCDLLLAASMYWLFLLMNGASPHPMHAWLPTNVLLAAICTVGVVLTRMLLDMFSLHAVARYMRSLNQKFLLTLMQGYGDMRWNVVVQRNRSELLKHATSTAQDAAYSYQMLIELAGESIVILLFALALIWVSPKLAVSVSCFVLCFYVVQRFFLRQRSSAAALQRDYAMLTLHRLGSEFLLLGKEIRTYRNQSFFLDRLSRESQQLGEAQVMVGFLPQVSRILVDQGTAVLFLSIIIMAELRNGDVRHLFALLVYYFVISQRLLPLVSHVAWMLAQLECAVTNVQTVRTELDQGALYRHPDLQTHAPPPSLVLHMQDVAFSYDASTPILQGVQFSMRVGELVVLHGPSGSGKSSLLNLIAGVSAPSHGSIAVRRERVAYVPQEVTLLDDSLRSNLCFGLDQLDDSALVAVLSLVQLRTLLESLPEGLETRVGDNGIRFSGGQRQRIGIARALLRNAALILLDEATSAMDEELERQVLTNLSAAKIALLLVSHRSRNRLFADRVLHLRAGKLEPLIDDMSNQCE